MRLAIQQGQPGLPDAGDKRPGLLAAPGLGRQRGQVVVGARDPRLVVVQVVGDPAGQLPRLSRGPPVPVPDRGQAQMAGRVAQPLQVMAGGPGRGGSGPDGRRAVQVGGQALPERDRPPPFRDAPPVQGAGLEHDPDHHGAGVRLGPGIGPPPGHRGQCRLGAFQLPGQRAGRLGQVTLEPQCRQAAREQVDRAVGVGQAGPEGHVGQPGGALLDVRPGQVGDGLRAGLQDRPEKIGEDVAPAVPRRRRDPAPRAGRPARRGEVGTRGQLSFLRRGDVADPVADLRHQRLLGPVEGDDHAERGDRGRPGRRHRADRRGQRPAHLPGEFPPGVGRGQRHQYPAVVHLVVEPDRRPPGLPGKPDHGGDIPGPDDVVGRLAQHGCGGRGDGLEPLVLCRHRALLSPGRSPAPRPSS